MRKYFNDLEQVLLYIESVHGKYSVHSRYHINVHLSRSTDFFTTCYIPYLEPNVENNQTFQKISLLNKKGPFSLL